MTITECVFPQPQLIMRARLTRSKSLRHSYSKSASASGGGTCTANLTTSPSSFHRNRRISASFTKHINKLFRNVAVT